MPVIKKKSKEGSQKCTQQRHNVVDMDPGRALRRWSDAQRNSLCLRPPRWDCLRSQAQLYSKLGQAVTGLHAPQRLLSPPAGRGWREKAGPFVSPTGHLLRGEMTAGTWRAPQHRLKWGAWSGLAASSCHVHGSAPGYSHPTAAVFPASLRAMLKNPDWHLLYFALRKKKKDAILSLHKYTTSNNKHLKTSKSSHKRKKLKSYGYRCLNSGRTGWINVLR